MPVYSEMVNVHASFNRSVVVPAFLTALALCLPVASVCAQDDAPQALLDIQYKPAARAQIAIWIERSDGTFVKTLRLTEAVAFRGIGNRPGASQMNSGYRWPYGRREGVLPVWASRRAAAEGASQFRRVVFQERKEGAASQTTSDQSPDDYFCLSWNQADSERDALDAVSCASPFTSDKGRFITSADMANGYSEPYEDPVSGMAEMMPLSMSSLYPPRMDVASCGAGCFDHDDLDDFAAHARSVMPEIDALTMATPKGDTQQSELFSVPSDWEHGPYVVWVEINVEGDYNDVYNDVTYPTPSGPSGEWDSWALDWGYPYRGQPSVAFRVPIELSDVGGRYSAAEPEGRSSWRVWSADYGAMAGMTGITDDADNAPGSGVDRLREMADGSRLVVEVDTLDELVGGEDQPDPTNDPDPDESDPDEQPGDVSQPEPDPPTVEPDSESRSGALIIIEPSVSLADGVGPIRGLSLDRHPAELHAHEWVRMEFRAPSAPLGLHRYEVRVGSEPIVDEETFLMHGRPAKGATEDAEGAASLMLPVDVAPGEWVRAEIGDLVQLTHYYVAVRGVDRLNRPGPITVAEIETPQRVFTTVSACFVASVAYGTPLAAEVGVLRRFRDRFLMGHAPGRLLVDFYYRVGPVAAAFLADHPKPRGWVRGALDWLVAQLE